MPSHTKSFLVIQTAFIGDVILATALVEKLRKSFPDAAIDFLLRKGNESLLAGNPHLREVIVWDKKSGKIKNLIKLAAYVRSNQYDAVINAHRFASSGLITTFSGAPVKSGFDKNPWSLFFTHRLKHELNANLHEIERNQKLIEFMTDPKPERPRLYPSIEAMERVKGFKTGTYICIAPTSVWFTKQFPAGQWISFLDAVATRVNRVFLLGAPGDRQVCEQIKSGSSNKQIENLAGQLGFLESAALMSDAVMNFVNDSAPLHIATSMNAPVTAVFCSTVPSFGFGPLSDTSHVVQTNEYLPCRPCGLHGHKNCPQGHFKCATSITTQSLLDCLAIT